MLGVVIAMETETVNLVKSGFDDIFIHSIHGHKFYVVKTLSGETAVITFSGIGKTNAALSTALLINSFNIKSCLNIGSAGIVNSLEIFDILIVDKVKYIDVDVTAFGYEKGQVPKMPASFQTNANLNEVARNLLKASNYNIFLGNCLTSDSFINMKNINNFEIEKTLVPTVLEMECAAIAQTCHNLKVPFVSIKVGIDKLYSPIENEDQFKTNLSKVQLQIDDIAVNLINALSFKSKEN
ncbi:MAG: 5'-methylthioadenosine/S-adenosylhomocysteine nucleosidase [Mycoplasma sp.]